MTYEVCDCSVDSVHGVASRHDFPTLVQASSHLIVRLTDEFHDRCAELYGRDEAGEVTLLPDVGFVAALESAVKSLAADECADVTYAGVRYWVEFHEEPREGGCQ
jgi:hypothetical protein